MYDAWMIIGEMAVNATGQNLREKLLGDNPDGTGQGWLDIDTEIDFASLGNTPAGRAHLFSPRLLPNKLESTHKTLRDKIQTILPVPIGLEALGQLYFGWGNPVAAFPPGADTGYTTADVRAAFFRASNVVRNFVGGLPFDHRTIEGRDNLALLCCTMMDTNFRHLGHTGPVRGFSQPATWAAALVADPNFSVDTSVAFSSWGAKLCFLKHEPYDSQEPPQITSHVSVL